MRGWQDGGSRTARARRPPARYGAAGWTERPLATGPTGWHMGAWGVGSFENDGALDFLAGLEEEQELEVVEEAIDAVIDVDFIDSDEASAAVAAVEVVAAMAGAAAPRLPKEIGAWARAQGAPSAELVASAKAALDAILKKSELRDLWDEGDEADRWAEGVRALSARLG